MRGSLLVAFGITLIMTLGECYGFSFIPLMSFAPFLSLLYLRRSFASSLWISALCGLFLDLLSSFPFGVYGFNFFIVALLLHTHRKTFNDQFIPFGLYTFFVSFVSSLLLPLILFFFDESFSLTFAWVGADLFLLPLLDAIYGLIFIFLPLRALSWARRSFCLWKQRVRFRAANGTSEEVF